MVPLFDPTATSTTDSPCGSRSSRKCRDGATAFPPSAGHSPKMALGTPVTWGAEQGHWGRGPEPGWCHPGWGGLPGVSGGAEAGRGSLRGPGAGPGALPPRSKWRWGCGVGVNHYRGHPAPHGAGTGETSAPGWGPACLTLPAAGRAAGGSGGGTRSLVPTWGGQQGPGQGWACGNTPKPYPGLYLGGMLPGSLEEHSFPTAEVEKYRKLNKMENKVPCPVRHTQAQQSRSQNLSWWKRPWTPLACQAQGTGAEPWSGSKAHTDFAGEF